MHRKSSARYKDAIYKEAGVFKIPGILSKIVGSTRQVANAGAKISKAAPDVVKATKFDDIAALVAKQQGIGLEEASELVRKSMDKGGTGSFFADLTLGAAKRIPGKQQPGVKKAIEDGVWKMRKAVDDVDIRAGNFVGKKTPNLFTQNVPISVKDVEGGNIVQNVAVKRLSAPLSKGKDFILPMVGAGVIAEKISGKGGAEDVEQIK